MPKGERLQEIAFDIDIAMHVCVRNRILVEGRHRLQSASGANMEFEYRRGFSSRWVEFTPKSVNLAAREYEVE